MKEKIKKFINEHKSEISLFVIMFGVTLLMAVITSLFEAEELTQIVLSVSGSIIALMGIEVLEEMVGMHLGDNKRPAILGIIIGVIIILI